MTGSLNKPPEWRVLLAGVLDVVTLLLVLVPTIARLTGNYTPEKISVSGWWFVLMIAVMTAYFQICWRTGGTLWERILRVKYQ